jgi:RNA polymerase sigma-70 factor (ECF subfamily)
MQEFKSKKDLQTINADISDLRYICEETKEPFFEEYLPLIKKLILELNQKDLEIIELRFFEKKGFKEIAEILEISEVNAKVRVYRIIEKLKKSISKIKV